MKKVYYYLIIFVIALVMCLPLLQEGIHTGHDGDYHIARTIGTMEQLANKNSPFIVSRFSNHLGYGWNLFYPPVTTFLCVVFAFLTSNAIIAMKLFVFCTFVLSGITMFQFVKAFTKNNLAALIASVLYMIAPYRLLNAYTRLAVGEMVSFIFIPMIFKGVYHIMQGEIRKRPWFILGAIGLVLSHNISTLFIFLLGVGYVLISIGTLKDKTIFKTFCISALVIILCVLFFEVPLLEQKSSSEYEVFRYGKMYSKNSVPSHALNPLQLLFKNASGADSSMYFCIGAPILLLLLACPFVLRKKSLLLKMNPSIAKNYKFFLAAGTISCLMATFLFPWSWMPDILLMIQFPWRMLFIVVFCLAIIGGINFAILWDSLKNKLKNSKVVLFSSHTRTVMLFFFSLLLISSCLYSMSFIKDLDVKIIDNSFYEEIEIIDPVYEVSRYSSFLEYWPQKAVRSLDYITHRDDKALLLSGNATIRKEENKNGVVSFEISDVEENTSLELPYLFYKGYVVSYTPSSSNDTVILDNYESDKGLVQVAIPISANGTIHVAYHATLLHKICMVISLVSFILYLVFEIRNWKLHPKELPAKL